LSAAWFTICAGAGPGKEDLKRKRRTGTNDEFEAGPAGIFFNDGNFEHARATDILPGIGQNRGRDRGND
jgi:hypothetical protein